MARAAKMLNALRRDCWGCDNNVRPFWKHRCLCQPTKTERSREKRQFRRDLETGNA